MTRIHHALQIAGLLALVTLIQHLPMLSQGVITWPYRIRDIASWALLMMAAWAHVPGFRNSAIFCIGGGLFMVALARLLDELSRPLLIVEGSLTDYMLAYGPIAIVMLAIVEAVVVAIRAARTKIRAT